MTRMKKVSTPPQFACRIPQYTSDSNSTIRGEFRGGLMQERAFEYNIPPVPHLHSFGAFHGLFGTDKRGDAKEKNLVL
jgi:hypothetical protein